MRKGGSSDAVVPLVESEDYYLDNGLMVLTAQYHLRRGYCCDQGCRHCPYDEVRRNADRNVASDEEIS